MTRVEFRSWRFRLGFSISQAAEALGYGERQIRKFEAKAEGNKIRRVVELACWAIEAQQIQKNGNW